MNGNTLRFETGNMFVDPGFGWGSTTPSIGEGGSNSLVVLTTSTGKLVKQQWRSDWADGNPAFTATVPASGGYHLTVSSVRKEFVALPSGTLSPNSKITFSLQAKRGSHQIADVIIPRLTPWGLNSLNRTARSSSTVVEITPDRQNDANGLTFHQVTAKSAVLQASFDNGRTWHSMPVKKSGTHWQATVKNPATSAFVDLRSRIDGTNKQWTEVTLTRAYRVG
jgi:hypothetical protein